jgi:signal transduction histidine kinase
MKKILIIEDQLSISEEVNDWFTFEGFETLTASNGRAGVELAKGQLPDLIVCDIMMPGMDGKEVLAVLRKNPSTRMIPFIFITALAGRDDIRTGMDLGADDYIIKPFTRNEMLNAAKTRLEKTSDFKMSTDTALDELRNSIILHLPHELLTPLNGILGASYLLKDPDIQFTTAKRVELGENLQLSATQLFRLFRNYLIYAQLQLNEIKNNGYTKLNNPGQLCETITTETAKGYDRSNDLELSIAEGNIPIEETEFKKIVEELTDNAFKFSQPGQKVIVNCGTENNTFRLIVKDYGRGMLAADIHKIGASMQFDRKIQEQRGSGLGLIIAKKLIELYGGKLFIESMPGKGSTFIAVFPEPEN